MVHGDEAEPPLGLPFRLLELPRRAPLFPERSLLQPAAAEPRAPAPLPGVGREAAHLPRDRLAVVRPKPRPPYRLGPRGGHSPRPPESRRPERRGPPPPRGARDGPGGGPNRHSLGAFLQGSLVVAPAGPQVDLA